MIKVNVKKRLLPVLRNEYPYKIHLGKSLGQVGKQLLAGAIKSKLGLLWFRISRYGFGRSRVLDSSRASVARSSAGKE